MEDTYNLTAIILNRRKFGEDDGRVAVYSLERGKLELGVRGLKKIKSKLAGHLEPITLASIMAVRGRQYDYVGAAVSEQCYFNIKNDIDKLTAAGEAIRIFNKIIKAEQADAEIFQLLKIFLDILAKAGKTNISLLAWLFVFKLLIKLGHRPELYYCVNCRCKVCPAGMKFDLARGGLVCGKCSLKEDKVKQLTISENSVKLLRLAEKNDFIKLDKININKQEKEAAIKIISSFFKYIF